MNIKKVITKFFVMTFLFYQIMKFNFSDILDIPTLRYPFFLIPADLLLNITVDPA